MNESPSKANHQYQRPSSPPNKKKAFSWEDFLISIFESLTSVFDQVYFLKTIGILKESSFVYRKLYKNNTSLKIWFVSLCLNLRRSVRKLFMAIRLKKRLRTELHKLALLQKVPLDPILLDKFEKQIKLITSSVYEYLWEIVDSLIYLLLVSLDLFASFRKLRRYQKSIERLATATTVLRFCLSVKGTWDSVIV